MNAIERPQGLGAEDDPRLGLYSECASRGRRVTAAELLERDAPDDALGLVLKVPESVDHIDQEVGGRRDVVGRLQQPQRPPLAGVAGMDTLFERRHITSHRSDYKRPRAEQARNPSVVLLGKVNMDYVRSRYAERTDKRQDAERVGDRLAERRRLAESVSTTCGKPGDPQGRRAALRHRSPDDAAAVVRRKTLCPLFANHCVRVATCVLSPIPTARIVRGRGCVPVAGRAGVHEGDPRRAPINPTDSISARRLDLHPRGLQTVDDDLGRARNTVKLEDDPLRAPQRIVVRTEQSLELGAFAVQLQQVAPGANDVCESHRRDVDEITEWLSRLDFLRHQRVRSISAHSDRAVQWLPPHLPAQPASARCAAPPRSRPARRTFWAPVHTR